MEMGNDASIWVQNDERLKRLIDTIPKATYGKDYTKADHRSYKGHIHINDIPAISAQHYPLCMQEMHYVLTTKHHLRHYARLQYGSFLKSMGLTLEESKTFFKREFSKGDPKKLNEYMYYIEHLYGAKGKKTTYSAWGCNKMQTQNAPSSDECHGCPYQYYGEVPLKQALLRTKKLTFEQVDEVLMVLKDKSKGRDKNPSDACRRFFYLTHPEGAKVENIGRHPNAYVDQSMFIKRNPDKKGLDGTKGMMAENLPQQLNNLHAAHTDMVPES